MPDFETLGRRAASLVEQLPQGVRNSIADVLETYVVPAERALVAVQEGLAAFAAGFAPEEEPWEAATDDPFGGSEWHCRSCKVSDAPVEELTTDDWLFLIDRYHPSGAGPRLLEGLTDEELESDTWQSIIKKWGIQARQALHSTSEYDYPKASDD